MYVHAFASKYPCPDTQAVQNVELPSQDRQGKSQGKHLCKVSFLYFPN